MNNETPMLYDYCLVSDYKSTWKKHYERHVYHSKSNCYVYICCSTCTKLKYDKLIDGIVWCYHGITPTYVKKCKRYNRNKKG